MENLPTPTSSTLLYNIRLVDSYSRQTVVSLYRAHGIAAGPKNIVRLTFDLAMYGVACYGVFGWNRFTDGVRLHFEFRRAILTSVRSLSVCRRFFRFVL
jgi:hypothetical protein